MANPFDEESRDVPLPREQAVRWPGRSPDRLWGGPSTGGDCAICGAAIAFGELELEVEFDVSDDNAHAIRYQVHVRCFSRWQVKNGAADPSLESI